MDFENKAPEWKADGVEPTEELKEKGFMAGYKPPAEYFNYLFNRISACISEVQSIVSGIATSVKEHLENLENPHNVKAEHIGLENVDNTKDADKLVKHATTADSATKATQDANGNVIPDTYATKKESNAQGVSGSTAGKNPTIPGATAAPLIYGKFKGYTEQTQYSGKNNLKVEESGTHWQCTATIADDGKITLTNTATSGVAYARLGTFTFKANTTYTISVKDAANLKHYTFFKAGTSESASIAYNAGTATVTPTADIDTELIVYMDDISTSGNTTSLYIQIEEGTEATDYEIFVGGTASPNPDYPQEIDGLGESGSVEVKTCGKNIFGGEILADKIIELDSSAEKDTEQKTIRYAPNRINGKVLFDKFKTETQYTFILRGKGNSTINTNVEIFYTDGTRKVLKFSSANTVETILVVTDANKTIESFSGMWRDGTTTLYYEQCGIFEGVITADEFTPYEETTASIPITSPLYEGDYIEVYADGSGKLIRKMGEVTIDGTNVKLTGTDSFKTEGYNYAYMFKSRKLVNNHVSNIGKGDYWNKKEGAWLQNANTSFAVVLKDEKTGVLSTDTSEERIEKFNTWLQSNLVTVVYELAEPTETSLTVDQVAAFKQLYTFENTTNVFYEGEAEIEIQYYKNNENGEAVSGIQKQVDNIKNSTANNLTTTEEGFLLDAQQGKVLNDKVKSIVQTRTVELAGGTLTAYGSYEGVCSIPIVAGYVPLAVAGTNMTSTPSDKVSLSTYSINSEINRLNYKVGSAYSAEIPWGGSVTILYLRTAIE